MRNAAILFCLCAAGCKAPNVTLTVDLPEGYQASELTLAVSVYAPGSSSDIDCDAIAFGDYRAEQLLPSLALSTVLTGETGELGALPRLGRKLVVVTGTEASGQAVVGGCSELGDVAKKTNLTVALEVGTLLVLDAQLDALSADVDWGGVTPTSEHVTMTAVDARGEPAAGVTVRTSTIGPSGRVLDRALLATDAAGGLDQVPSVHFAGPFAVEYAARFGLDAEPLRVPGFAVNADPWVDPFADHDDVKWASAARIEGGTAGFVGVARVGTPSLGHAVFLSAPISGWSAGQIQFGNVVSTDVSSGPVLPIPVGSTFHLETGTPHGLAKLLQHVELSGTAFHFDASFTVVGTGSDPQPRQVDLQTPGAWPATGAVPLGRCGADRDPEGLPLLIALSTPTSISQGTLHVAVTDLQSQRVVATPFFPRSSHCVVDADGAWHRVLFGREFASGTDDSELVVVDLGSEQISIDDFDLAAYKTQVLPFTQAGGSVVDDDGQPRLVLASFGGFSMLLEMMQISSDPERVLDRVRVITTTVPANTFELASGALLVPGRRDYLAMLDLGNADGEPAPVVLYVLTGVSEGARPLAGGHLVPYCLRYYVGGVPISSCRMLITDVDGDGLDEVLISYFNLRALGQPSLERTGMMVLRLGEW